MFDTWPINVAEVLSFRQPPEIIQTLEKKSLTNKMQIPYNPQRRNVVMQTAGFGPFSVYLRGVARGIRGGHP